MWAVSCWYLSPLSSYDILWKKQTLLNQKHKHKTDALSFNITPDSAIALQRVLPYISSYDGFAFDITPKTLDNAALKIPMSISSLPDPFPQIGAFQNQYFRLLVLNLHSNSALIMTTELHFPAKRGKNENWKEKWKCKEVWMAKV